jgi:hypothetical protein
MQGPHVGPFFMTKITKVIVSPEFANGPFDYATWTDMAFMTPDEIARMSSWVSDILDGKTHVGANKPSWLSKGSLAPGAEPYRDNNIWHYHCGPYKPKDFGTAVTNDCLDVNYDGHHCAAVYHYAKNADTIVVLGYSRSHSPFPTPGSKKNPLVARGALVTATFIP